MAELQSVNSFREVCEFGLILCIDKYSEISRSNFLEDVDSIFILV